MWAGKFIKSIKKAIAGIVQLARTSDFQSEGYGFKSHCPLKHKRDITLQLLYEIYDNVGVYDASISFYQEIAYCVDWIAYRHTGSKLIDGNWFYMDSEHNELVASSMVYFCLYEPNYFRIFGDGSRLRFAPREKLEIYEFSKGELKIIKRVCDKIGNLPPYKRKRECMASIPIVEAKPYTRLDFEPRHVL